MFEIHEQTHSRLFHSTGQTACKSVCNRLTHKELLQNVTLDPDVDNLLCARQLRAPGTFAENRQPLCDFDIGGPGGLCTEHVDNSVGNLVRAAWRRVDVGVAREFGRFCHR